MASKQIIGALVLVAVLGGYYIYLQNEVKLSVTNTQSSFYVWENGKWNLSGQENNYLYNGTKSITRGTTKVETSINQNYVNITRTAQYGKATLIDTYTFDGNLTDKTLFPIEHYVTIINGNGLSYRYVASKLLYSGPTRFAVSPESFGHHMQVAWTGDPFYSHISSSGTLTLIYEPLSDYETFSIRLFDPSIVTIYLNTSSSDRKFELGDVVNVTGCTNVAGDLVILNSSDNSIGNNFTSGITCVTYLWNSTASISRFNDSTLEKNVTSNTTTYVAIHKVSNITSGTAKIATNGTVSDIRIYAANASNPAIFLVGNVSGTTGTYNFFSDRTTSKNLSYSSAEEKTVTFDVLSGVTYTIANFTLSAATTNTTNSNFSDNSKWKVFTMDSTANSTAEVRMSSGSTSNYAKLDLTGAATYNPTTPSSYPDTQDFNTRSTTCTTQSNTLKARNGTMFVESNLDPGNTYTISVAGATGCTTGNGGGDGTGCNVDYGDTIVAAGSVTATITQVTAGGGYVLIDTGGHCYQSSLNPSKEYTTDYATNVMVWVSLAGANASYNSTGNFIGTQTITLNNTQVQQVITNCGTSTNCLLDVLIQSSTSNGQINASNVNFSYQNTVSDINVTVNGTKQYGGSGLLSAVNVSLGTGNFQSAGQACTTANCTIDVKIKSSKSGNLTVSANIINYTVQTPTFSASAFNNYMNGKSGLQNVPISINASNFYGNRVSLNTLNIRGTFDSNITFNATSNGTSPVTTDSQVAQVIWSNFSTIFPAKTKEPIFIGIYNQTQNITPYGQTSTVPGINFTYGAQAQCMNISVYTNASLNACMNLTMSSTSSKTNGRFFNTTNPNNIITNLCSGSAGVWFWLDMNSSCASQTRPYIFYKSKCSGCV